MHEFEAPVNDIKSSMMTGYIARWCLRWKKMCKEGSVWGKWMVVIKLVLV
jgi:hypothetical protein